MKYYGLAVISLLLLGALGCTGEGEYQDLRGQSPAGTAAGTVSADGTKGKEDPLSDSFSGGNDNDGGTSPGGSGIAEGSSLELSWNANSEIDINGYGIYGYIEEAGVESAVEIAKVSIDDSTFDPKAPKLSLSTGDNSILNRLKGRSVCVVVSARTATSESEKSDAQCLNL